jgi:putative phosphoribosyl transferase
MIYENRKMAGQLLAQKLKKYKSEYNNEDVIVLALPRGGVPVAEGVALEIQAPLEILAVRKIGAPHSHELALGAICEKESPFWNSSLLDQLGLRPLDVQEEVFNQRLRIDEQILKFRKGEGPSDYLGKVLIIVDDGLATGATAMAAARYLKGAGANKVVLAVPVASSSSLAKVRDWVDEVVVLQSREDLSSVGEWYNDFSQVSDEEVISILKNFESKQAQVRSRKSGKKGPINQSEMKRF